MAYSPVSNALSSLPLLSPQYRDTSDLLKTTTMEDAYSFVDTNSHPRLWRILAEQALEGLDFVMADKAFVRCADYQVSPSEWERGERREGQETVP